MITSIIRLSTNIVKYFIFIIALNILTLLYKQLSLSLLSQSYKHQYSNDDSLLGFNSIKTI